MKLVSQKFDKKNTLVAYLSIYYIYYLYILYFYILNIFTSSFLVKEFQLIFCKNYPFKGLFVKSLISKHTNKCIIETKLI